MRQSGRAGTAVAGERHVAGGASALAGIEGQPVAYSRGPRRVASPFSPERLEEVRRREAEQAGEAVPSIEGTEPEVVQVTAIEPVVEPAPKPVPKSKPKPASASSGRPRGRVLSAEKLRRDLLAGASVEVLARRYRVCRRTILATLREAGIEVEDGRTVAGRRRLEATAERDAEIVRLYLAGETYDAIAEKVGCNRGLVGRVRERAGIPARGQGRKPGPRPATDPTPEAEPVTAAAVEAVAVDEPAVGLDEPVPFTLVDEAVRVSAQLEQMHAALATPLGLAAPLGLEAHGWTVAHERALCTAERMEALAARIRDLVARMGVEQAERVKPRIVELERAAVSVLLEPFGEDS